jgi:aminoglycoside phosphotransferase (APT) family kinase protein
MNMCVEITPKLVQELLAAQFPEWAHLPITPVELSGHDNRTFRLGEEMLVRLPSSKDYAEQVKKEQKWLPIIAPHLSFPIPQPLTMGKPTPSYPWHWSIYKWLDGASANSLLIEDIDLPTIALQLAQFLNELHQINTQDAPPPGLHNYWRGAHPSVYDTETKENIPKLSNLIDIAKALAVWEQAISAKWTQAPVWIHGDFASGNIVVKDRQLAAIIDFGCMGIGDPACDLVIAWTFLKEQSRQIFKDNLSLDAGTWARARGWALWKASFELVALEDKASREAKKQLMVINEIINE